MMPNEILDNEYSLSDDSAEDDSAIPDYFGKRKKAKRMKAPAEPPQIPKDIYDKLVYDEIQSEKRWWGKRGPCRPSDKGMYGTYSCYRNEFRKIHSSRRLDYAFPFADGT